MLIAACITFQGNATVDERLNSTEQDKVIHWQPDYTSPPSPYSGPEVSESRTLPQFSKWMRSCSSSEEGKYRNSRNPISIPFFLNQKLQFTMCNHIFHLCSCVLLWNKNFALYENSYFKLVTFNYFTFTFTHYYLLCVAHIGDSQVQSHTDYR